jgi:hypothetical protein
MEMDPTHRSDYETVIRKVLDGKLRADERGVLQLPPELASASQNGRIYISQKARGATLLVFSTWIGKGYNLRGFLYASQPLTGEDFYHDYDGNQVIEVGPTELVVEEKLSENWYAVARSMD